MKQIPRRRCANCHRLYKPDPRNRRHQRFCSRSACRKVSKHSSQRNWIHSPKGKDYFSGNINISRVKEWRSKNPGYWRRRSQKRDALQDFLLPLQVLLPTDRSPTASERALQDILNSYRLILIGLIDQLPHPTDKEVIEETYKRLILAGEKASASLRATVKSTGGGNNGSLVEAARKTGSRS